METLAQRQIQQSSLKQIHANELPTLLDHYQNKIKVLSLDCFDTLLWRKTASPVDVFYELQHQPTFRSLGFTPLMRIHSEMIARRIKMMKTGKYEVQLDDIYRTIFPKLTPEEIDTLAQEELAEEIKACFAYPPILNLMKAALAQGLKVIIVSDTYFKEAQLRKLLQQHLPSDMMNNIKEIFCSNEYEKSKSGGIFADVLKKLNVSPDSILHVGDNPVADFTAPLQMKINAVHFLHHDLHTDELIRLQTSAMSLIDPTTRHTRSLSNSLRGVLSLNKFELDKPEKLIGYAGLGPILFSFAKFILNDVKKLRETNKNLKVLFLMRDAYLPSLACEALQGEKIGYQVRISRFTSYAASFCTQHDVDEYLADNILSCRFEEICKQLLLPPAVSAPLIQTTLKDSIDPPLKFSQLIHQKHILEMIFKNSANYRQRLKRYLEKEVGLQSGDTLVFVDLGYSGTAQRRLENVFRAEFNINIIGRYLIAFATPGWEETRRGLLDHSSCDDRTMHTLVAYIALLEQLCTSHEKSVIDYDNDGNPIFNESSFSAEQYNKLALIQSECINFVKDTNKFLADANTSLTESQLRDSALSALTRLIYLPTENEIKYLESFQFDLNLGTNDVFNVLNTNKGLQGLRRRGFFSSSMEKNSKEFRTNTPAELRAAALELSIALMAQHRFTLDFGLKDLSLRRENINVLIVQGKDGSQACVDAQATHDGYYSLVVPMGNGNFNLGILFGQKYRWIQFESIEFININHYLTSCETQMAEDAWSNVIFNDMQDHGSKLYECKSASGFLMFIPVLNKKDESRYVLRVVFRPIVRLESDKNS